MALLLEVKLDFGLDDKKSAPLQPVLVERARGTADSELVRQMLFILFLLALQPAQAEYPVGLIQHRPLTGIIFNSIMKKAVTGTLAGTCTPQLQNSEAWFGVKINGDCERISRETFEILSCRYVTGVSRLCFAKELGSLLNHDLAEKYLRDLEQKISSGTAFNLYDFTLDHALVNRDVTKALETLAVLFQTNRSGSMHRMLKDTYKNAPLLKAVLQKLEVGKISAKISLYPSPMVSSNQKPDHFYVPAYLATRFRALGHSQAFAFLMAYNFNTRYEMSFFGTTFESWWHGTEEGHRQRIREQLDRASNQTKSISCRISIWGLAAPISERILLEGRWCMSSTKRNLFVGFLKKKVNS